eukprot:1588001-Prymnesium_polylepis.1
MMYFFESISCRRVNGSFNKRTRQGGCGPVGRGARTDAICVCVRYARIHSLHTNSAFDARSGVKSGTDIAK